MENNFFPAIAGSGNVCAGVEIAKVSDTKIPNGCSCKPNDSIPCTYNKDLQGQFDDQCYLCTTADLMYTRCPNCTECLKDCGSCIGTLNKSDGIESFKNCLDSMDNTCRKQCDASCKKH